MDRWAHVTGTRDVSFDEHAWRYAGAIYGVVAAAMLLWTLAHQEDLVLWPAAFAAACAVNGLATWLMPWATHPRLAHRANIAAAAAIQALFVPYWYDNPPLMVLPAFGALFTGSTTSWRWALAQMAPALVVLTVVVTDQDGLRIGVADAAMYGVLWACVGAVSAWFRARLDDAAAKLIAAEHDESERQAAEAQREARATVEATEALAAQTSLATSLQSDISEVTAATASIEAQSGSIAASVDAMAASLHQAQDSAAQAEENLADVMAATASSHTAITELNGAGDQIAGIVSTITALSEQTNMLALNATIEAARAGDAGRGFGVVAHEVKELANRTAASAADISAVIDQIRKQLSTSAEATEHIVELVAELEATQRTMTASVSQQTNVIQGISSAAASGADGVSAIGGAIRRIDDRASELIVAGAPD